MSRRGEGIKVNGANHDDTAVETTRALYEAREMHKGYEASALADMAEMLVSVAESLARTSRELREAVQDEWMDADETAAHLK